MLKLSTDEIIEQINQRNSFEAVSKNGGFNISVKSWYPWIGTAIHEGHNFSEALVSNCLLSDYERWYEEDPNTHDMISSAPIVLWGNDSRFEYDLNRGPENTIYDTAWGKQCWKTPLSPEEKSAGLEKHTDYYSVLKELVTALEADFGKCILFDMHSYNWKRHERTVPIFNLGTDLIDISKWRKPCDNWLDLLRNIELPNIKNITTENDVFKGHGYQLRFINEHFENTLVFATEISKIYCDELNGEIYHEIVAAASASLEVAMKHHFDWFQNEFQIQI